VTRDLARECAEAWAAYIGAGLRAGHNPSLLMRALLHAAERNLSRLARSGGEGAEALILAAARAFLLLRIAVRTGAYDPGMPGELLAWILLLRLLPTGWADALELATREAGRGRPTPPCGGGC
jgi:hypothetical protein